MGLSAGRSDRSWVNPWVLMRQQPADYGEQGRQQCAADGDAEAEHLLEDLEQHVFLGDVAGDRRPDRLDLALDLLQLDAMLGNRRDDE